MRGCLLITRSNDIELRTDCVSEHDSVTGSEILDKGMRLQ